MNLNEFAQLILFGTTLEEKLAQVTFDPERPANAEPLREAPRFPGRPEKLSRIGNAKFPSAKGLGDAITRGQVLHFFANHELLAMELMALVLLKFPEAPPAFRQGLARTIQEEQSHMRLYIERMRELGVEFGDLPLSDYFWNSLKSTRSPLEFVTQMSLTFEQANLDFSLYYRDEVAKHGDEKTAAILDRVYREEIGHVKHGLAWFNRWRENSATESDWDAYKRLLPSPLTPRRAKGLVFCAEARREAGFSETFIRELEINSGSKGRPPVLWFYNPSCDSEIARGKPGFSPPKTVQNVSADLEPLLMMLARDGDFVWVKQRPRIEWLKEMSDAGFKIPEFIEAPEVRELREPKLGGVEPWGWSPDAIERLRPFADRLIEAKEGRGGWDKRILACSSFEATGLAPFFSKAWSARFLGDWLRAHPEAHEMFGGPEVAGLAYQDVPSARAAIERWLGQGQSVAVKAPLGTSGNQVKRISDEKDLAGTLGGWLRNTIATQGNVVIEPWLDKLHDLSIQMEIGPDEITLFEAREFLTDRMNQYQGAILGKKMWRFAPETLRLFAPALKLWHVLARDLGKALRAGGYQGPAGIDALIWKTPKGELRLKPLVELNPRWTMGRVALALEDHVVPGTRAAWLFLRKNSFAAAVAEREWPARFVEGENGQRLERGVFCTNDPENAREIVTALVIGDEALAAWLK